MPLPLLSPIQMSHLVFESRLDRTRATEKLSRLRHLRDRTASGVLRALVETRIEQSFNEQLFAEVFEYTTLFRSGGGEYHILPKNLAPGGRFDDFSVGFFAGAGSDQVVARAELKSPGTDLDAPQLGNYGGISPVQQAFRARGAATWLIVSNFDELRLYHHSSEERCEVITLTNILSLADVERAWAILGRQQLLGTRTKSSPLADLFESGTPMTLPVLADNLLLVQEARIPQADGLASIHKLDEAVEAAMRFARLEHPIQFLLGGSERFAQLEGDRLVIDRTAAQSERFRLEATRDGVLRLQEYIPKHNGTQNPIAFMPHEIARSIARFAMIAQRILSRTWPVSALEFQWSLEAPGPHAISGMNRWNLGGCQARPARHHVFHALA
jgi:hypothetical protein